MNVIEYSSGYYQTDLVPECNPNGPIINSEAYYYLMDLLQSDDVIMRVGLEPSEHFHVEMSPYLPVNVIGLTGTYMHNNDISELDPVFVLKSEFEEVINA